MAQRKPAASDKALGCGCLSAIAVGLIAGIAALVGGQASGPGQGSGVAAAVSASAVPSPTRTATLASVTGQGLDKVEAQLKTSGFTWHAYFPGDTTEDPDQMADPSAFVVCQQSPAPGRYLAGATTVQLAVVGSAIGCDASTPPTTSVDTPGEGSTSGGSSDSGGRSSGATAMCKDGTLSYSQHHQGTCSHHGGVAVWYK